MVALMGVILQFTPWTLNWFGKLPGNIRIESQRVKVFIPITSMVIVSVILTLIVNNHFLYGRIKIPFYTDISIFSFLH
jgi:hypothetical protein